LIVKTLLVGPIQTNCYIVGCEETKEGMVIDPGGSEQIILEEIERLGLTIEYVINTHGHSPGGVSLYNEDEGVIFSGDTLFNMGIGRYDLPGGDYHYHTLMASIRDKILSLPAETVVYSGHGPETTVGREKWSNPFLL